MRACGPQGVKANRLRDQFPERYFLVPGEILLEPLRWSRVWTVVNFFWGLKLSYQLVELLKLQRGAPGKGADRFMKRLNITEEKCFKLVDLQIGNKPRRLIKRQASSSTMRFARVEYGRSSLPRPGKSAGRS